MEANFLAGLKGPLPGDILAAVGEIQESAG